MAHYAHAAHHGHHCMRAELLHQVGGDVVRGVRDTPFEAYGGSYHALAVRTARSPGAARSDEGLRQVDNLGARVHAFLHSKCVEERLDGGTYLTFALADVVVFEIAVVRSADICFDMAGSRLHGHEGRPEKGLVVAYRVVRRHRGVDVTLLVVGEDPHLFRLGEGLQDLGIGETVLLEHAPAVAPLAGLVHHPVPGGLVDIIGERVVLLVFEFAVEVLLQGLDPFGHGLLRVLLHLVVDGRVYPETVTVEVVLRAVCLPVLLNPAVQFAVSPGEGVHRKIFALVVVRTVRLLGGHHAPYHIPEIRGPACIVVEDLVGKFYRNLLDGISLILVDVSCLFHLPDDEVPPGEGLVRIQGRVVPGRLVGHSDEGCGFFDRKFGRLLGEEGLRSRPDSVGVAAEEDGVEIHGHDLILGVVLLELDGSDPLLELDPDHLHLIYPRNLALSFRSRIQGLGELLGDGTSSSLAGVAHEDSLEQHPGESFEVDAGMIVETGVFGSYRGMYHIRGQFFIGNISPVLYMESREDFSSFGNDLCSKLIVRVFQFLERRNVSKCPDDQYHQYQKQHRKRYDYPEPLGNFLLCVFGHNKDKFITKFGKLPRLWFTLQFEKRNKL